MSTVALRSAVILAVSWAALPAAASPSPHPPRVIEVEHVDPDAAKLLSRRREVLAPLPRGTTSRDVRKLEAAGTLDFAGHRRVLVSVVGTFPGPTPTRGSVGVLLLPDVPLVNTAVKKDDVLLLPLRIELPIRPVGDEYFGTTGSWLDLAFPRYRAWLYNTGDESVEADVYFFAAD